MVISKAMPNDIYNLQLNCSHIKVMAKKIVLKRRRDYYCSEEREYRKSSLELQYHTLQK